MEKPFSRLSQIESPARLKGEILERIGVARKKAAVRRFASLAALEIASVAAAVASFAYVLGSLKASGVPQYLSLIFTDGTAALAYSKELSLSILEALPALSIAIALAACIAFAWSTARLVKMSRAGIRYA